MVLRSCKEDCKYIFFSYSHKNMENAYKVIERLQNAGFNVWFDEGIEPGSEYNEYIATHVKKSTAFIAFMTPEYTQSKYCKREIMWADRNNIPTLFVYGKKTELTDGMDMIFNSLQAISMYEVNENVFYDKLFSTLIFQPCRNVKKEEKQPETVTKTEKQPEIKRADVDVSNLKYVKKPDGTIKITGYVKEPKGELVIPEEIDGCRVTEIGGFAFRWCESLTSVDMPCVTTIGESAFWSCKSLTSVDMPCVTQIVEGAFDGCTSLTSVDMPSVTGIGEGAFDGCESLTSVDMPSVTQIGESAFRWCESLTSVDMPSVTTIGKSAFGWCKSLTSVDMPCVTMIGEGAFDECVAFSDVYLYCDSTRINKTAFPKKTVIHYKSGTKGWSGLFGWHGHKTEKF